MVGGCYVGANVTVAYWNDCVGWWDPRKGRNVIGGPYLLKLELMMHCKAREVDRLLGL